MPILRVNKVNTKSNREETLDWGASNKLYHLYEDEMNNMRDYTVDWHWHYPIEFFYAYQGEFDFYFSGVHVRIRQGEGIFINSNVLHSIQSADKKKNCIGRGIVFDYHLMSGMVNSYMEQTYFMPLIHCSSLPFYVISPIGEPQMKLLMAFLQAYQSEVEEHFGYEIQVQKDMLEWWWCLLKLTHETIEKAPVGKNLSMERLKSMISYIEEHYMDSINLERIAEAASISTRECSRCFQKNIHITPTEYLTKYRLNRAMNLLLETTMSILEISELCGFSSSGYFSKLFTKEHQITPAAFRKQYKLKNKE